MTDTIHPVEIQLSVVIAVVSDTTAPGYDVEHLNTCLEALSRQINPPTLEIIVPYPAMLDEAIGGLRTPYPDVLFVPIHHLPNYDGKGGSREHHNVLRARGLALARGTLVGFLEDYARPDLHWGRRMVDSHQKDFAAIGGAIENGVNRPLNWAVYFCDFINYMNPVIEGVTGNVSDANVVYKLNSLRSIWPVGEDTFEEHEVNQALLLQGEKLVLSQDVVVYHHRRNLSLFNSLKERFIWGRSYSSQRGQKMGMGKRSVLAGLAFILPAVMFLRATLAILKKRRNLGAFVLASPLTALLMVSWSLGEMSGFLTRRASGEKLDFAHKTLDFPEVNENSLLSVIVTIVGGGQFLHRCLSRLVCQMEGNLVEILVPYDGQAKEIETLFSEFPQVSFINLGEIQTDALPGSRAALHELYDRRIAAGLQAARGEIVAILQDYCLPADDWCRQILQSHRSSHGVIGGSVEHHGVEPLNWAIYFLDFSRYAPPLEEGPVEWVTDVNVTYKRAALCIVENLWDKRYKETEINWALALRRVSFYQKPEIVVSQDRGHLFFSTMLQERFAWGRLLGSIRAQKASIVSRMIYAGFSVALPFVLISRAAMKVIKTSRHSKRFLSALPLMVVLAMSWSFGEMAGYLTGREG